MKSTIVLLSLLFSTVSYADYISISCGKFKFEGLKEAEITFQAESVEPDVDGADWAVYKRGREQKSFVSVKTTTYAGHGVVGNVKKYTVTEKAKPTDQTYLRYVFTNFKNAESDEFGEYTSATLYVYEMGGLAGTRYKGKKSCIVDQY